MAKKKKGIPNYGRVTHNGIEYYRTRVTDADGKRVAIYGETPEELYEKVQEAKRQIEDAIYRRENPTVADYCEKWLKMRSATIRPTTLKNYEKALRKHIVKPMEIHYCQINR